ncbi:MAG: hypothetical protein ACP5MK_00750 [Candidatus Micrarchaeia archaeon]
MKLFDIAFIEIEDQLANALGFARIYADRTDLNIATTKPASLQPNTLMDVSFAQHTVKNKNVIGFVAGSEAIDRKTISMLKENDKPLFFNASILLDETRAIPAIYSFKQSYAYASKIGAKCSIASFARDMDTLFSAAQLIEIAKLIGAKENTEAKSMLGLAGKMLGSRRIKREGKEASESHDN